MLYALIIVTNAGMVSFTPGFPTLALCLDAKSIAETGRTVVEQKNLRARWEEERTARMNQWRAAHPPRPPVTEEELRTVEYYKKYPNSWMSSSEPYSTAENGMILDWPGSPSSSEVVQSRGPKFARCVGDVTP